MKGPSRMTAGFARLFFGSPGKLESGMRNPWRATRVKACCILPWDAREGRDCVEPLDQDGRIRFALPLRPEWAADRGAWQTQPPARPLMPPARGVLNEREHRIRNGGMEMEGFNNKNWRSRARLAASATSVASHSNSTASMTPDSHFSGEPKKHAFPARHYTFVNKFLQTAGGGGRIPPRLG